MSADARLSVPGTGDNGKTIAYNESSDRWDVASNVTIPGTLTAGNSSSIYRSGSASYGWSDIIGNIVVRQTGPTTPTLSAFRGGVTQDYAFDAGDQAFWTFHPGHSFVAGSDVFIHLHTGHNATSVSGSLLVTWSVTAAARDSNFPAEITLTQTVPFGSLARWQHHVHEVQLSTPGGSASQLNSSLLDVDSIITVAMTVSSIPSLSGGSPNLPFIFEADLHVRTRGFEGTVSRSAPFDTP